MAVNITRWLGKSRPLGLGAPSYTNTNSYRTMPSTFVVQSKVGFQGEKITVTGDHGERKNPVTEVKASVAASESVLTSKTETSGGVDIAFLLANVGALVFHGLKVVTRPRPSKLHVQMFIEKAIIDCRFFTMFAVAGTLLGSVLCFVEGCFMILDSYFQYFHALSHGSVSDPGHHVVVQLLIEAIDMFLVGTTMLILGLGLHVMFVGTQMNLKGKQASVLPASNFFGHFYLQKLPTWIGMQSITQAKSKMGHALMMILQVGVLDKLKTIPVATGLDLACFAAALFISSASIFLLSRLSVAASKTD